MPRLYRAAIPSRRITRRHYAEQLDWWAASGWVLEIEDGEDGMIWLHTAKEKPRGSTCWGATAKAEEVATPALIRQFLTTALYVHLHPRKARAALAATGYLCTQQELAAFIRQQRRKWAGE